MLRSLNVLGSLGHMAHGASNPKPLTGQLSTALAIFHDRSKIHVMYVYMYLHLTGGLVKGPNYPCPMNLSRYVGRVVRACKRQRCYAEEHLRSLGNGV